MVLEYFFTNRFQNYSENQRPISWCSSFHDQGSTDWQRRMISSNQQLSEFFTVYTSTSTLFQNRTEKNKESGLSQWFTNESAWNNWEVIFERARHQTSACSFTRHIRHCTIPLLSTHSKVELWNYSMNTQAPIIDIPKTPKNLAFSPNSFNPFFSKIFRCRWWMRQENVNGFVFWLSHMLKLLQSRKKRGTLGNCGLNYWNGQQLLLNTICKNKQR